MAVPKQKISKSKRGMRRGSNGSYKLNIPNVITDENGDFTLPHHVSSKGNYNGRKVVEEKGINASRNGLQTVALLDGIVEHNFDCAMGGARRDEEKARAKERFFSHRDDFGQWDPKNQRPEIWNLYNAHLNPGENMRVFPLSNWTETDVWEYVQKENLEVPNIYFSHERECFFRARCGYRDAEVRTC